MGRLSEELFEEDCKRGPFNQASAKQPAIFGKALTALAIVESFALFAFVLCPALALVEALQQQHLCVTWEIELEEWLAAVFFLSLGLY